VHALLSPEARCYLEAHGDDAMTKLERAVQEAEQLPEELREKLGDDLLHYIHKYLALRDEIDIGLKELDAGLGIPADEVFADLRARYDR
jgi:predicted transcriptional regulator